MSPPAALADHDEEAAFAVAAAQVATWLASGSPRSRRRRSNSCSWVPSDAAGRGFGIELTKSNPSSSIQPSTSSIVCAGLVRMAVLILEPGLAFAVGADRRSKCGSSQRLVTPVQRTERAARVVQLAAVGAVEADDEIAAGSTSCPMAPERARGNRPCDAARRC